MTAALQPVPDGFVARLHDDVQVGPVLVAGTRVLRLAKSAQRMIVDRSVTVGSPASAALADRLLDLDLADPDVSGIAPRLGDLTVVVPVRDNPDGVDRLLKLVARRLTCVVVDDASTYPQALATVVAEHGAYLVRLAHNVGPAAARNVGFREVATPLVAFIDSDVAVSVDALAELTTHFADPRLAAVAPRVRSATGPRWFQRYEAACGSLDLGPVSATLRQWSPVSYVPSACLLVRTDDIGRGFDPHLRSGEDVDLVWNLQAAGHRVRYVAQITAQHDSRRTARGWLGRKTFYGTSAAPLAARHNDRVAPAVLTPSVAMVTLGMLAQRRWSVAVAAVGLTRFVRVTSRALDGLDPWPRATMVAKIVAAMGSQVPPLMLRHWWPLSVATALVSSRARRALMVTAVIDGLVAHRKNDSDLDPVRFTLARRADDLAYGAGVWWGATRARSAYCLLPRWIFRRSKATR